MNNSGSCHILLVGELSSMDTQLMDVLNAEGRSILMASSAQDAIALLLEYTISIIVIDIAGRTSRGIEQALLIRSSDRFKPIPILFLLERNPDPHWTWPHPPTGPIDVMIKPLNRFILNHKLKLFDHLVTKKTPAESDTVLTQTKRELEKANTELYRLTQDLEAALSKANKMAVEAEIATISKSSFLASMSHEIRTPLNAVVGFTDLMQETDLSPEQKEYIDAIRCASNTFLELINDILDFSKIEAGMVQLEEIPFSPERIIEEVLGTLGIRAYEKGLELACSISDNVPHRVIGDPVRLKQILVNLVGNAIKFTSQGEIIVRVEHDLESTNNRTCCLHFSISDSGIGLPESKQARLFQPFSQAAQSTTREFGGTGLGLAISKQLAERMLGRIWIQSPNPAATHPPGTIFNVQTRFARVKHASPAVAPMFPQPGKGHRVLIQAKNPTILSILKETLSAAHVDTLAVQSQDVITDSLIRECGSGLTFSHVLLDDASGITTILDVATSLRRDARFDGQIVLMTSPTNERMARRMCDNKTLDALIRKPIRRSALLALFTDRLKPTDETPVKEKKGAEPPPFATSLNILLVEDNTINQKVTTTMLNRLGHLVSVADNGKRAIDLIDEGQVFDLILMDGQMPVMDGFQATKTIRRREADQDISRTPIIALTANAMKGDRQRYIQAGMDDYIPKPVRMTDLSDVLGRVMNRKKNGSLKNGSSMPDEGAPVF